MATWDRWSRTRATLLRAATRVQQEWIMAAQRSDLSLAAQRQYVAGLEHPDSLWVGESANEMTATITNRWTAASRIEAGHPPFHLPSHIRWASTPGARRTKDGRFYLLVPFRHYSAQRGSRAQAASPTARRAMMPRDVYTRAQQLQPGERLRGNLPPYMPRLPQNRHPEDPRASIYAGMQRTGSGRGTRYLTFRTMTEDSPGWWIPAQAPHPLAQYTQHRVLPVIRQMLAEAARADVEALARTQLKGSP